METQNEDRIINSTFQNNVTENDSNNHDLILVIENDNEARKLLEQNRSKDTEGETFQCNNAMNTNNNQESTIIEFPKIVIPDYCIPLVSFDIFKSLQPSFLISKGLEEEYKIYKENHEKSIAKIFYDNHNKEEWFKEIFNPDVYYELHQETKSRINKLSKAFIINISLYAANISMTFDKECFNDNTFSIIETPFIKPLDYNNEKKDKIKENKPSNTHLQFNEELNKYHILHLTQNTVFFATIPTFLPLKYLLNEIYKTEGVYLISIGGPIRKKNYFRYIWVIYESEAYFEKGMKRLKEVEYRSFYLSPLKCQPDIRLNRIRITLPLYPERTNQDTLSARKIIQLYSYFYHLNQSEFFEALYLSSSTYSQLIQLDLMILYLRKVFGFCYYCLKDYKDERTANHYCGLTHLRSSTILDSRDNADKNSDLYLNDLAFDKAIEEVINTGLSHPFKPIEYQSNKVILLEKENYIEAQIMERPEKLFQCIICNKLFMGKVYIMQHIENKHFDLIEKNIYMKHSIIRAKEEYMKYPNKQDLYYKELKKIITDMEEYEKIVLIKNARGSFFRIPNSKKKPNYIDFDSLDIKNDSLSKKIISYDDL